MHRILILNGPNLNMLGVRRPDVYGATTQRELERLCREWGAHLGLGVETFQSNHEGELIDRMQAMRDAADGVVLNPAALGHYSYALHDAIEAVGLPTVEVHISDIKQREEWRRHTVTGAACVAIIYGRGIEGYRWALNHLAARAAHPPLTIHYGDDRDQVGDLRLPGGDGPHPVIVLLHGGFWRDPWQRDVMDLVAVDLASRGWAVWNIEYRRVGTGGGWPVTLSDVAAAVDHVAELAVDHPLDTERVATLGHSTGGHLALWAAGRHRLRDGDPGAGPRVQPALVVAIAPLADLAEAHAAGLGDGAVEDLLRRSPADGDDRYRVASPARLLPLATPQVVLHGERDDQIPFALSENYVAAARDAGDDAALVALARGDHFSVVDPSADHWAAVLEALARVRPDSYPADDA